MQRFTLVSLSEGLFGSKLELELQTGNQITGVTGPLRNGRGSALIQPLNFYNLNPVSTIMMDRFIDQPKFAGKRNLSARNQSKKSGRNQSYLFQEVLLIDIHSQCPIAASTLFWTNYSLACMEIRIPCTVRMATV